MKQFLRVFAKIDNLEPSHVNVSSFALIIKVSGDNIYSKIDLVLKDGHQTTGFVTNEDWIEFQRTHVVGIPPCTTDTDTHLDAIADSLSRLTGLKVSAGKR